jgi:hypothetical protein
VITGSNNSVKKTHIRRGTGKSQSTSPSSTHKPGGAIMASKLSHGVFDNRGQDTDRINKSRGKVPSLLKHRPSPINWRRNVGMK